MTINKKKLFFSVMIISLILLILIYNLLLIVDHMNNKHRIVHTRMDSKTIAYNVIKYNLLEKSKLTSLMDLKEKYLTNIDSVRDTWGNLYEIDTIENYIFSSGPDGKSKRDKNGIIDWTEKENIDNIRVSYSKNIKELKDSREVNIR